MAFRKIDPNIRARALDLMSSGMSVNQVARAMRGMIDRTTLQEWSKKAAENQFTAKKNQYG